jgi:hypothetical protein
LSFVQDLFYSFLIENNEEKSYTFKIPEYIIRNNKKLPLLEKNNG